jgi:hypothetical protein
MTLRPYQARAVEAIERAVRALYVLPTGGGKPRRVHNTIWEVLLERGQLPENAWNVGLQIRQHAQYSRLPSFLQPGNPCDG